MMSANDPVLHGRGAKTYVIADRLYRRHAWP
jgi:hypothetical protein